MSMAQDWKAIAKLRLAEGDEEGAARALRNAQAYVGRTYGTHGAHGLLTVWRTRTRPIYRPTPHHLIK